LDNLPEDMQARREFLEERSMPSESRPKISAPSEAKLAEQLLL